jgi:RTX calcium-binding nonapeptide repeat (4 copies)
VALYPDRMAEITGQGEAGSTRTSLILCRSWSVAAACLLVSVFALAAPAGAQAPPACGEQAPTIVGTNGADLLVGTPGDDVIVGLGGRDVIVGKATCPCVDHAGWQPEQAENAGGGAGRRSAKIADAPMDQSREAHHPAWPLHSPEGDYALEGASEPAPTGGSQGSP